MMLVELIKYLNGHFLTKCELLDLLKVTEEELEALQQKLNAPVFI